LQADFFFTGTLRNRLLKPLAPNQRGGRLEGAMRESDLISEAFSGSSRETPLANLLAVLLGALLLAVWLYLVTKRDLPPSCWRSAALIVLSLLPVYHRFYDARLLIFPLAWNVMAARNRLQRFALLTVICILPFLIPGRMAGSTCPGWSNSGCNQHCLVVECFGDVARGVDTTIVLSTVLLVTLWQSAVGPTKWEKGAK
jgi:hypothetical protein